MPKASKQATNGPERSIKSKRTEELRVECVIKTKSQKKEIKQKIRKRMIRVNDLNPMKKLQIIFNFVLTLPFKQERN